MEDTFSILPTVNWYQVRVPVRAIAQRRLTFPEKSTDHVTEVPKELMSGKVIRDEPLL